MRFTPSKASLLNPKVLCFWIIPDDESICYIIPATPKDSVINKKNYILKDKPLKQKQLAKFSSNSDSKLMIWSISETTMVIYSQGCFPMFKYGI